jgi:hypothetical protein
MAAVARYLADKSALASIGDPKALLSPKGMAALKATFDNAGKEGEVLFNQTVVSIRTSLEAGLQSVFLLGAITMLMAFLLILTVPEISMDGIN